MKAFLENNFNKQSSCELSSKPPVSAWLSSEQVQLLSNSCEGEMLLMLINDLDLLATECIGKKYCSQEYKKPEKLPFQFSSDKYLLLKKIRRCFSQLIFTVIKKKRACFGKDLEPCEDQRLTMIDIINYERLLVKIIVFIFRDIEKFDLSCESLLVDFKRTVALGEKPEFYNLVNLTDEAFEIWLDMQSSLYKAIRGEVFYRDTQVIAGVNRFLWSFCDYGVVSPGHISSRQKEILDYLVFFLIPDQVLPLLFSKSVTSKEKTAASATTKESQTLNIEMASSPRTFPRSMNTDLLTIGEEFELLTPQGEDFSKEEAAKTLHQWHCKLEEVLKNNNISDFSIAHQYDDSDQLLECLEIRIGNWHCRVYEDYGVLEVNTSPYHLNEVFTIQGSTVAVYHCFNVFILDIAKSLRLPTRSGHKHIGIENALYGNGEILLRLLLDVEKRSWLPRLFMRERRADSNFTYMRNCFNRETCLFVLNALITSFNQQLQICPDRKINESFHSIKALAEALIMRGVWSQKMIPLNLLNLSAMAPEQASEGVREARTTIEFRFPQAPRTGEEAQRINELLIAWLQLMEQHQHDNKPLKLELGDPMDYAENKNDEVERLFCDFVKELGLDWNTFRHLSFLPQEKLDSVLVNTEVK